MTFVIVGSVEQSGGEDPHLAEEHGDQQRGAGGVGGGGQQVRHPGGEGEHRGGDEVEEDVLPVQADQLYLHPNHGVVALLRPGLCRGLFIIN